MNLTNENAEQKKPNPEVRVADAVDIRFKSRQNYLLFLEVWIVSSYLSGGMEGLWGAGEALFLRLHRCV